jgi:hypothetical protein
MGLLVGPWLGFAVFLSLALFPRRLWLGANVVVHFPRALTQRDREKVLDAASTVQVIGILGAAVAGLTAAGLTIHALI